MASFMKSAGPTKVANAKVLRIEKKLVRVSDIKMGMRDWLIKVTCMQKNPMKTWQNPQNSGCYMSVDFIDSHPACKQKGPNDAIQVTFFKECARSYETLIEQDKTYYISNGTIKAARFSTQRVRHPFCIHLDEGVKILNSDGDMMIEKHQHSQC